MITIVALERCNKFLCTEGFEKGNSKLLRTSSALAISQQANNFFLVLAAFNEEQLQKLNLDPLSTKFELEIYVADITQFPKYYS